MTLAVDASVAIKWIVPEADDAIAKSVLPEELNWVAPEFLMVELGSVLRTKLGRQQIDLESAKSGYSFVEETIGRFVPDRELAARAFEIALEVGHSIYDCMYLACAEAENARVVTADKRLIGKLLGSHHLRVVHPLVS